MLKLLPLHLAAAAVALAPERAADPFDEVVAAERAFAADAGRIGITAAFRAHADPAAVLFRPAAEPAADALARERDDGSTTLEWQPAAAAVSRDGRLGFTTGPYRLTIKGQRLAGTYLTVWRRGADGRWRWVLDQGLPPRIGETTVEVVPVARLDAVPATPTGAPVLAAVDAALNGEIDRSGDAAVAPYLASDARVLRPPATENAAAGPGPARGGKLVQLFAGAATSDDLGYTYGRLEQGGARSTYVRIWRRDGGRWQLLVDELVPGG